MKRQFYIFIFILFGSLLCASITEAKFFSQAIARERLITDLFVNYDATSRPTLKNERLDVNVNIALQHFDFHERDGSFRFVGLLDVSWHDPKLYWNPSDYNNLSKIPISQKIVWIPDLEVYNNAPDKFLRMHRNGIVVLEHTGKILWSDVIDVSIFCTTNVKNWPRDEHVCKLSLGSWTYNGYELDIIKAKPNQTMNFNQVALRNMEFEITFFAAEHVATVYACCAEPYITMDYHLTFARRSSLLLMRLPPLCIIILTLLSLCMTPQRSEKLWLNAFSFIVIIFQLLDFTRNIAAFARTTPTIVTFYGWSLVLVTFAELICVFSLAVTRQLFRVKMPQSLIKFMSSRVIKFLAPAPTQITVTKIHQELDPSPQFDSNRAHDMSSLIDCSKMTTSDWTQLAYVTQRIALILLAIIYLILASSCLSFKKNN